MCGILPYTEEGVGFLSQIQYSTDQQFIINDTSVLALSDQPDNILCASYDDGNIFELESNWEMVMQAKCPLGMASGIGTYIYELPSEKDVSLNLKAHHSDAFFTPLIKPIQKLNGYFKQFKYIPSPAESLTLPVDTPPFNFPTAPQKLSKVQLVIHNFLLQMNQPVHAKNMETIYYTIHSLLRLGAKSYTDQFLKSYISDSKRAIFKDDRPNILLPSQQKLVTDILIIVLINFLNMSLTS